MLMVMPERTLIEHSLHVSDTKIFLVNINIPDQLIKTPHWGLQSSTTEGMT